MSCECIQSSSNKAIVSCILNKSSLKKCCNSDLFMHLTLKVKPKY